MGFWQGLYESYEKNEAALKSLYPISTTSISNNGDFIAVIIIDGNGNFIKSEKIEKANHKKGINTENIIIPVTEKSSARSSGIEPHPLFDQFDYLKGNGKKFEAYLSQLEKFAKSDYANDAVKVIFKYVSKKNIENDLKDLKPKGKINIIFKVEIPGKNSKIWEDEKFFENWHNYYVSQKKNKSRDYISGTEQIEAISHPKKIVNSSGNAKLISDNDESNFTFRGKFDVVYEGTGKKRTKILNEAFSIGYESSQKAHQFLRYLVNDRGIPCDSQVILSYTIGEKEKLPEFLSSSKSIFSNFKPKNQTELDKQIKLKAETGFDYAEALKKALASFYGGNALTNHERTAVIALDAATTGRLSVTFYREFEKTEYLERIADWHNTCKWYFKISKDKKPTIKIIEAPSVDEIIKVVYGKARSKNDANYNKIKKQAIEQIIYCIFDGVKIPKNYILNAVHRISNPLAIKNEEGKFNQNDFETMLSTVCALFRKFHQEENYKMSLESDRNDRDYLYGRLLGAADKLESYALYKNEKERTTNAIRYMNAFSQKPFKIWADIHDKISIYFQKGGVALREIENIIQKFEKGDYENNAPLSGLYLLGFYHERAEIERLIEESRKQKEKSNQEETTNV